MSLLSKKSSSSETMAGIELVTSYAWNGRSIRFAPDVVNNLRRMITHLHCSAGFPRRLSVVSSIRSEGVTFTTLALAVTLASDFGSQVCVVETNWWAPGLEQILTPQEGRQGSKPTRPAAANGTPPPPTTQLSEPSLGLAGVLTGASTLERALVPTDLTNLKLLPAGNLPIAQRPVAARSTSLRNLITELSCQFEHVLLDIPAVLNTSDALVLAAIADATCLVVLHGVTSTNTVRLALDELKSLTMLGVILNRVRIRTPRFVRALIPQE